MLVPCLRSQSSTKRCLWDAPLNECRPGGHVTPDDVIVNPMATFSFNEVSDIMYSVRGALEQLRCEPAKVEFVSDQAKTSAAFWFDRLLKHLEYARVQKERYKAQGDWQFYWDLEQAERVAANLLKTVSVKPKEEVGCPFSPLFCWVDYFSHAFSHDREGKDAGAPFLPL